MLEIALYHWETLKQQYTQPFIKSIGDKASGISNGKAKVQKHLIWFLHIIVFKIILQCVHVP